MEDRGNGQESVPKPIHEAISIAKADLSEVCTVQEWAALVGYKNAKCFSRHFRKYYGERPTKALSQIRVRTFIKAIKENPEISHYCLAREIGIRDEKALYKFIKYHTGKSPSVWKKELDTTSSWDDQTASE